jgi:2-methylcitrate dehydratase PrpD
MARGIAASRAGGLTANTGTMVKSTHPGNAARMGAESAMLAAAGYTSNDEILEAENGYAAALFQGNMDWEVLTNDLGATYRLVDPGFDIKRFPAQVYMQNSIEAALNLRERHNIQADQVESLVMETPGRGHSGPTPQSGLDGKFSIEYCAAAALLDGQVGIDSFTDQRRFAPDMEETLGKVRVQPGDPANRSVRATAHLKDGSSVSEECHNFTGSVANPMNRQQRQDKVWDCVKRALSEADGQRVIALLEDLENVPDVAEIMAVLGQASAVRA